MAHKKRVATDTSDVNAFVVAHRALNSSIAGSARSVSVAVIRPTATSTPRMISSRCTLRHSTLR